MPFSGNEYGSDKKKVLYSDCWKIQGEFKKLGYYQWIKDEFYFKMYKKYKPREYL